jgi:hypothetical protein
MCARSQKLQTFTSLRPKFGVTDLSRDTTVMGLVFDDAGIVSG